MADSRLYTALGSPMMVVVEVVVVVMGMVMKVVMMVISNTMMMMTVPVPVLGHGRNSEPLVTAAVIPLPRSKTNSKRIFFVVLKGVRPLL